MKKVLQSIFVGLLFGLTVMGGPVNADYQIKDGNGTTQTIDAFTCATSKICPGYVSMDYTGAQFGVTGNPFFINFASGATLPPFASTPTFNCGTGCGGSGGTAIVSLSRCLALLNISSDTQV